jgi:hypothetical protein
VRGFSAGREESEMADRNRPFQSVAVKPGPLIVTRDRLDCGIVNGGCGSEIRRDTSGNQKGAYDRKPKQPMDPSDPMLAASAIVVQPHIPHLRE